MSIDLIDVVFRIERNFGVKIGREQLMKLAGRNDPPDITLGELFDFVNHRTFTAGVLDEFLDAGDLWPMFQATLSQAWGANPGDFTKDQWFFEDLGKM